MIKVFQKIRRRAKTLTLFGVVLCLLLTVASTGSSSRYKQRESPLTFKLVIASQGLLSEATNTKSASEVKPVFDWTFNDWLSGVPEITLPSLFQRFRISSYERNSFYIFNTASAP